MRKDCSDNRDHLSTMLVSNFIRRSGFALRSHSLVQGALEELKTARPTLWQFQLFSLVLTLGVIPLVYFFFPGYLYLLREEGSLVEGLTAAFYLSAVFIALLNALPLYKLHRKHHKSVLYLVIALAVVCFLDEVSFGLHEPLQYFGYKIDGVHDIIDITVWEAKDVWEAKEMSARLAVLLAGACVIGLMFFVICRSRLAHVVPAFKSEPFLFLATFLVLNVAAQLIEQLAHINVYIGSFAISQSTEEMLEMNAAIALILCALALRTAAAKNLS